MTINAPRMLPNRIGTFPYPPISVPRFSAVPKMLFLPNRQIHPLELAGQLKRYPQVRPRGRRSGPEVVPIDAGAVRW
jgi:hypothetical protein